MCGIAGIIYRDGGGERHVGRDMTAMLQAMKHRGPDSTGYALYRPAGDGYVMHVKLAESNGHHDFDLAEKHRRQRSDVEARMRSLGADIADIQGPSEHAMTLTFGYEGDLKELADYVEDVRGTEVLSLGKTLEIVKDLGDAETVSHDYGLDKFIGTHAIGHARMATESDVDIANAHPYWAYPFPDVAVVHNGQLTNYHQWKRRLERAGHRFQSECDSEIIAVYLAERMAQGDSLEESMQRSLSELDGVFTYICVTEDALGVAKDELGREAAGALRVRRHRRACVRGDRHPQGGGPRDRDLRPVRGRGDRVDPVANGGAEVLMDPRGLVELDETVPNVAEIDGDKAQFDAKELTTRKINAELRRLVYELGIKEVTILNPSARHSLGTGILTRCKITFEGSLGYFGVGLIDGPEIQINGRVGWSVAENMMSGVVVIESNAGSLAGAALRGGDLVVKGQVGARTGIDQKGGTIVVMGDAGSMTGFMMQRGRQIICGDVGPGLGDSMYDGTLYVAGKVKALGIDCVEGEWDDADTELIQRKFRIYGLGDPPQFQKFVCGKKLYNYDSLEPSERKLVL